MRIVSLVPSMTETLLAWGITPLACTRFCEQPDLPHVGGTKNPEVAAIAALRPDMVIIDAEENRREDYDHLLALGVSVHVLRINSVNDVGAQLTPLAAQLGVDWKSSAPPDRTTATISAFIPIWRNPWIALGSPTYGSSLLASIGVSNVYEAHANGAYPATNLDEARSLGPQLVIAPSEPYAFGERHRAELKNVGPTVFIDGKDLVWWGTRTADAGARLHVALHDRPR